jgi:hydroxypyruvate isomerase
MKRETFLTTAAIAAGGLALNPGVRIAAQETGTVKPNLGGLKHPKIKMAIRGIGGFFTGTVHEQLEQVAAWGAAAYEKAPSGDLKEIKATADRLGLKISVESGAGKIGKGGMVNPADHDATVEQLKANIEKGRTLDCKRYLCLTGNQRDDISVAEQTRHVIECLKRMSDVAEANDVMLVVETLNTLVNHKGYFMATTPHTMEIMEGVDSPRVKMLFDVYHQQITEGNVIRNLTANIDRIGHFHIADNPGRHEPGTGELNYTNILKAIAATNYDGYVATEFSPLKKTPEGKIASLNAVAACLDWT